MKKLSSLMLLAFTILFAACQDDLIPKTDDQEGKLITISATVPDNVNSRLSYEESDGNAYSFAWETGDELILVGFNGGEVVKKDGNAVIETFSKIEEETDADLSTARFQGKSIPGATRYEVYYKAGEGYPTIDLATGAASFDYTKLVQTQDMSSPTAHFKSSLFLKGEAANEAILQYGLNLSMQNAIFRFNLADLSVIGADEITEMKWISNGNSQANQRAVTLNFSPAIKSENQDDNLYMCFDPVSMKLNGDDYIKLEFKGNSNNYIARLKSNYGKTYEPGHRYQATVNKGSGIAWLVQGDNEIWVSTSGNAKPNEVTGYTLEKVTFLDYWTYKSASPITEISTRAFKDQSLITAFLLPNTVTNIGQRAFQGCTGITSFTVPSEVTTIGEGAFAGCTNLKGTFTIPATVTTIGEGVFAACPKIENFAGNTTFVNTNSRYLINSANKLLAVAPYNLTSIADIPAGVTAIGNKTFDSFTALTSITLPEGITHIGTEAFNGCTGLEKMVLPKSLTTVGANPFKGCTGMTELTVVYDNTKTTIVSSSTQDFNANKQSESMVLNLNKTWNDEGSTIKPTHNAQETPAYKWNNMGWKEINLLNEDGMGISPLPDYENGTEDVPKENEIWVRTSDNQTPGKLGTIDPIKVSDSGVWKYVLSDGNVPENALLNRTNVTEVDLPTSITNVGTNAFSGCTALTKLTFKGASCTIGANAVAGSFSDSKPLTIIAPTKEFFDNSSNSTNLSLTSTFVKALVKDETQPAKGIYHYFPSTSSSESHIIPIAEGTSYWLQMKEGGTAPTPDTSSGSVRVRTQGLGNWFKYSTDKTINELARDDFRYESFTDNIISLSLPNLDIEDYSIASWADLSEVIVEGSPRINEYNFTQLFNLKKFKYNDEYIDNWYFLQDNKLMFVLYKHDKFAFAGDGIIEATDFPKEITSFGSNIFSGFATLKKIAIPDRIVDIPSQFTYMCQKLTTITFGEQSKLKTIGKLAFTSCESLDNVVIPSQVTTLSNNCFESCIGLSTITLPSELLEIKTEAFSNCSMLTGITLPSKLQKIGRSAFKSCKALSEITIPASVTEIGPSAFDFEDDFDRGLRQTLAVTFEHESNLTKIGYRAFNSCILGDVVLPAKLEEIEYEAFIKCSIGNLTIPSSVKTIGNAIFASDGGCSTINMYAPYSSTINTNAFSNGNSVIATVLNLNSDWNSDSTPSNCKPDTSKKTWMNITWGSITLVDGSGNSIE